MAIKFDNTINAGHILSAAVMIGGLFTTYNVLDKRVVVLEERSSSAIVATTERQTDQKETLREIKSDIKDLQKGVNEITRAISARTGATGASDPKSR